MAWLRAADTEVKRDMEISRDEVRVMTVHGAKGLEASVVFLVDTTSSPSDTQRLRLIHLPQGNAAACARVVVWAGRKAEDPPAVVAARAAMIAETEDEYRRLLYVAMTRAADRLIVGGCMPGNMKSVRTLSWYDLIAKGSPVPALQLQEIETPDGMVKRYSRAEDDRAAGRGRACVVRRQYPSVLPDWLRTPAQPETAADSLLRPSDPADGERHPVRTAEIARRSAPAPCSAARWCIGCCNRCPISPPSAAARPRWAISRATPTAGRTSERQALAESSWP